MSSGGGFTSGAQTCPTDQATVLTAIIAKLINDLQPYGFTDDTCVISDAEHPSPEVHDNIFCMVCPMNSDFDGELPIGGGPFGIMEHCIIRVSVFTRLMLDPIEQAKEAYLNAEKGLLVLKKAVLKSLAGQQLYGDYPANTRQLLSEYARPLSAQHPPIEIGEDRFNSFSIVFSAPFFWDLT